MRNTGKHHGKWLIFSREKSYLDELAKKLNPYVEQGKSMRSNTIGNLKSVAGQWRCALDSLAGTPAKIFLGWASSR
jgi:hypothetical protein